MENIKLVICVFFLFIYNGLLSIGTDSIDCNFDDGFCNWMPDTGVHWKKLSGPTPTAETGPDADHTSGVGHFIYIDSSEEDKNKRFRLRSPVIQPGSYCLSLWYYMFGGDVDDLRVLIREGTDQVVEIFSKTGDQGKKWILIQKQIDTDKTFKIFIEGRVKNADNHDYGDIAIDDIVMFYSEKCPKDCGNLVLPEFGLASTVENSIGSKIEIRCKRGYEIAGNSLIVCQANGTWSDSPVCKLIDCGHPETDSKIILVNSEGTTFNKTIVLACEEGFSLIGNTVVTCRADGNWTMLPSCVINNCSDPTPESGFVNSTNFQYGSVVEVTCIPGYTLTRHSPIICQANLTWSDSPACSQIDCGIRNITNGRFNASLGTTYGNIATQSCEIGYTLQGDKTLFCHNSGWNGTFATCTIADSEARALIAVSITVPFVVFVLVILLIVLLWKKRSARNGKRHSTKHVTDTHPIIQYQNDTYNENANNEYGIKTHKSRQEADESMSADKAYEDIDHDRKEEASENIYYNTPEADCSEKEFGHHYDHTMKTSKPAIDKTYSHITGNVTDKKFTPSYDTVSRPETNDEPLRFDAHRESESYDHINIKHLNEDMKQELSVKIDEDESNYDHAKAGGIDPLSLEQDEYSHLNDANIVKHKNNGEESNTGYQCQYSNVSEITEKSNRIDKEGKAGYEEPIGHTPHYFVLERNRNENEDVKNNFVLETEESCDETGVSCNHDYFILEKTCLK